MQLKESYYIATNVCSRKSATTFGDLPDCLLAPNSTFSIWSYTYVNTYSTATIASIQSYTGQSNETRDEKKSRECSYNLDCRLFGTKQSSNPMPGYCQLDH